MIVKDYQSFFGYDMINTVITALQLSNCPVTRTNWGYTCYTVMWQNQSPQLSHDKIKLTVLTTVTLSGDKITLNVLTTVEWQDHTFLTTVTLSGDKFILSLQLSNDKITFIVLTTVTWQDQTYSPDSCCRWTLVDIHISPRHGHMACHPHTGTPPYSLCHKILSCRLKYNTIIQNIIPICLKLHPSSRNKMMKCNRENGQL